MIGADFFAELLALRARLVACEAALFGATQGNETVSMALGAELAAQRERIEQLEGALGLDPADAVPLEPEPQQGAGTSQQAGPWIRDAGDLPQRRAPTGSRPAAEPPPPAEPPTITAQILALCRERGLSVSRSQTDGSFFVQNDSGQSMVLRPFVFEKGIDAVRKVLRPMLGA